MKSMQSFDYIDYINCKGMGMRTRLHKRETKRKQQLQQKET